MTSKKKKKTHIVTVLFFEELKKHIHFWTWLSIYICLNDFKITFAYIKNKRQVEVKDAVTLLIYL